MAETTTAPAATAKTMRRKTIIGKVVSTSMQKTIVVEVKRQFSHRLYRRVIARFKKFYAHDEDKQARVGDYVKLEETRPLSKLKRWRLAGIVQRAALVEERPGADQAGES